VDDWPYPWSRLEDLADEASVEREELRDYLRAEIEYRQRVDVLDRVGGERFSNRNEKTRSWLAKGAGGENFEGLEEQGQRVAR
jgi:hypothetical protein